MKWPYQNAANALTEAVQMPGMLRMQLIPDQPAGYGEWRQLVSAFSVQGRSVHDARLVAAMLVANITTILTFNVQDFTRYQRLLVLSPSDVLAGRLPAP